MFVENAFLFVFRKFVGPGRPCVEKVNRIICLSDHTRRTSSEEHDGVISEDLQLMSLVHTKQETCDYYSPTVEDENIVDSLEHWSKDSLP